MQLLLYITIFFSGACLVSFLNVVGSEDLDQLFSLRRSHCDFCQKQLSLINIIPILSYLKQFGKSNCCNNPISLIYPLTETLGGIFLLLFYILKTDFWFILPIFATLILLSFSDYYKGYIYPYYYLLLLPAFIMHITHLYYLQALIFLILLKIFQMLVNGIGSGDIDVLVMVCLLFGIPFAVKALLFACIFCLVVFSINQKRSFRFIPYLTISIGINYLIFDLKIFSFPELFQFGLTN